MFEALKLRAEMIATNSLHVNVITKLRSWKVLSNGTKEYCRELKPKLYSFLYKFKFEYFKNNIEEVHDRPINNYIKLVYCSPHMSYIRVRTVPCGVAITPVCARVRGS